MSQVKGTELKKGSIVKFVNPDVSKGGFCRVTRVTKNTVNLGSIWGNKIYYKGLPRSDVVEAEAEWYNHWMQSESYRSM